MTLTQLNQHSQLSNMAPSIMSHQQQQRQQQHPHFQPNGRESNNGTLTSQPPIVMSPMLAAKNSHQHQQHQSIQTTQQNFLQSQHAIGSGQMCQQSQQVPMTTIMIPAAAASQLQSVSLQIQQAAIQASPHLQHTPQILVFMIPYMINYQQQTQLPPSIPMTPEHASLNSTLVRHSHSNSSMLRHNNPMQQNQQIQNSQLQGQIQSQVQPQAGTSQQAHNITNSHNRANSSLSSNNNSSNIKQEPERFYIKANFSHRATRNRQELSFQKGDILHVLDTLQNNDYGAQYWLATRVNSNGEDAEKGLIPNKSKAEEMAIEQRTIDIGEQDAVNSGTLEGTSSGGGGVLSASVGRVNFLKRRSAQRSKSLCKDNWDNVIFDIGSFRLPVYERVVSKHPGFCRPVVIFGPISDLAREKLLKDYPEKYSYPTGLASQSPDHPKVIRLKGVLDVIDQGKHALLDITAQAVEKLNYVNLAPIVIFMKTESKSVIKEFRARAAESLEPNARDEDTLRRDGKSSRKLLEQSMKLEKQWFHVFTAVLDLSTMGSEMWYRKLREIIENQQSANVWMGEKRSPDKRQQLVGTNSSSNTITVGSGMQSESNAIYSTTSRQSNYSQKQFQQLQNCTTDSSSVLSEKLSECMNLTTKSANDLLPAQSTVGLDNAGLYGNRSQLRNAYAHSLAQKLARASSEPKLNGGPMMSNQNVDQDEDDDATVNESIGMLNEDEDDEDDDECIKKPLFPNEYDTNSSISSSNGIGSNGVASFGQYSLTGLTSGSSVKAHLQSSYQHQASSSYQQLAPQLPHHIQQQVKPPAPLPPQAVAAAVAAVAAANAAQEHNHHQQQQQQQQFNQAAINRTSMIAQESIYSMNGTVSSNTLDSLPTVNTAYGANNGAGLNATLNHHQQQQQQSHRDYHPLPPMATLDNGYSTNHHQQQQAQTMIGSAPPTTANTNGSWSVATANGSVANGFNSNSNGNNNNVIELASRGSAYHIYSDMNQNNYHYFNMNKI